MTNMNSEKKRARALQERTGKSYQYCLNIVRKHTAETIEELIALLSKPEAQR